jgi:hypothetical protein
LQSAIDYWSDPSFEIDVEATGEFINGFYGTNWPKTADQVFLDTLQKQVAFWTSIDTLGKR